MIATTAAIILQVRKFGDTSKIIQAYTEQFGKISLLAKGARSPKSKFGGALEQLGQATLTFYKKPNRDLHLLSKAEIAVARRALGESYERLTAGLAIAEAIESSQESEEHNPLLFQLVAVALDALAAAERNEYSVVVSFQIRLAELMGFSLTLDCEGAMREPRTEYRFSFAEGAVLSPRDYRVPTASWVFSPEEYTILHALSLRDISVAAEVRQSAEQKAKIHDFLARYFQFHIEKKMRYQTHTLLLG